MAKAVKGGKKCPNCGAKMGTGKTCPSCGYKMSGGK